jgi:hypothetical protein
LGIIFAVTLGAALLVASCTGGSPLPTRACVPGMSVACACTNGGSGAQICTSDGLGYGSCICSAPGTGGRTDADAAVTGGSQGSGGRTDGGAAGTGGSGGIAGPSGTGGYPEPGEVPIGAPCAADVRNKRFCSASATSNDASCWLTCGPNKSGFKNCICSAGAWSCPVCAFDPGQDYSCYRVPAGVAACPLDPSDPVSGLPASGSPCVQDACKPCGSAVSHAYRDSGGVPKIGYCVCVPSPDAMSRVYSCASINEWPAQ